MGLTMVTGENLSYIVSDLLELPRYPNNRKGKAYEIVKVIIKAMREALLRGERIEIDGFGIFSIRQTTPGIRSCYPTVFRELLVNPNLHRETIVIPSKKKVVFKPSKVLLRMLNDEYQISKKNEEETS